VVVLYAHANTERALDTNSWTITLKKRIEGNGNVLIFPWWLIQHNVCLSTFVAYHSLFFIIQG